MPHIYFMHSMQARKNLVALLNFVLLHSSANLNRMADNRAAAGHRLQTGASDIFLPAISFL
jgi:hypothetical protein